MFRDDPGLCPICGVAHAACTADSGPITLEQLPQRDAMLQTQTEEPPAELAATVVPEAEFKTSEYARAKHGAKRPR